MDRQSEMALTMSEKLTLEDSLQRFDSDTKTLSESPNFDNFINAYLTQRKTLCALLDRFIAMGKFLPDDIRIKRMFHDYSTRFNDVLPKLEEIGEKTNLIRYYFLLANQRVENVYALLERGIDCFEEKQYRSDEAILTQKKQFGLA